jgi:hypothetical protein
MSTPHDDDDWLGVRRPERETLIGFRDWYAQVVINKVEDLTLEQASTPMTPSGISPLGIVKHLAWAEAGWYRDTFDGEGGFTEVSNEESFVLQPDDTVESVVALYRDECARSREIIVAAESLEDLSARPGDIRGYTSLRWIVIHMLEETARHAGHLDLMREQIDGRTGD